MGLFDGLFNKKSADGLPESFSGLYKETEVSEKRGKFDLQYGFRCLEKLYRMGTDAVTQNNTRIDIDKFLDRMQDLAEVYKTGSYWWSDGSYKHPDRVCDLDLNKSYACYMLGVAAAAMVTNDFQRDYVINTADAHLLVIEMYVKSGIGMAEGYLHSPDPKVSDRRYAASHLAMAVLLSCGKYGNHYLSLKYESYATQALRALIPLQDMLLANEPLSWYADKCVSASILSENDSVIKAIRALG